jgi:hypothetical protein
VKVPVRVNDLLEGHVGLDLECLDRIYLNGYVPNLQVSGQVVNFLTQHLGCPIASPAVFEKIGTRFRAAVRGFCCGAGVPVVRFGKKDRKIEVMRPLLERAAATGRSGVVAVGMAQEFQLVFTGAKCSQEAEPPRFTFSKNERRTTCFYFYLWDVEFGPAFVKICAYFPYPVKIWVKGHEWAKRQAIKAGIGFTELSNGFAACDDPVGLQAICDQLGPAQIQEFADRWLQELPTPFTRGPGGRLLVGPVDAAGRDLPHRGVHSAPSRPGVL